MSLYSEMIWDFGDSLVAKSTMGGMRGESRKGNVYLKTALVEAATAATKAKGTYLRDKFYRLKPRRGYKRAVVAVAHKILVAIYHILFHQVCYNELRDLYLDKLNKHSLTRNVVHRLERLSYTVTLEQKGRMNSLRRLPR